MIEHPVPQNITAYEFRLIGNMTIKQFVLLGSGGVVGFIVYSTNLPGIIKWPIISIAVVIGIALAFLPYEERSLDQWFMNFIKAMYRPTKFYWRRLPKAPDFFTFTPSPGVMAASLQPDLTPYRETQVRQFLTSLTPETTEPVDELDFFRQSGNMSSLFAQVAAAANVAPGKTELLNRPSLQTRPRPLRQRIELTAAEKMAKTAAATTFAAAAPGTATQAVPAAPRPRIAAEAKKPAVDQSVTRAKGAAAVVPVEEIAVGHPAQGAPAAAAEPPTAQQPSDVATAAYLAPSEEEKAAHGDAALPAVFNRDLPFPTNPEKPNILIGMVHDGGHAIVPGAIVEIVDETGNTVRAMKTNNLGQFYMSSPLKDGPYTIHTEKETLKFPIYQFAAAGKILDPVDITASG